jgi:hypothetical protein
LECHLYGIARHSGSLELESKPARLTAQSKQSHCAVTVLLDALTTCHFKSNPEYIFIDEAEAMLRFFAAVIGAVVLSGLLSLRKTHPIGPSMNSMLLPARCMPQRSGQFNFKNTKCNVVT